MKFPGPGSLSVSALLYMILITMSQWGITSSLDIESLAERLSTEGVGVCLAYVYCDYRDEASQTAVNLIGALLKQVLITLSTYLLTETINSLTEKAKNKTSLSLYEAFEVFLSVLRYFDRFYICIDALDECNEGQRKHLLPLLAKVFGHSGTQSAGLFVTGRPYMEKQIEGYFQVSLGSITLSANADDIRRYVTRQLEMDDNYGDMDDSFKKEITDIIVDTADGMFVAT